MSTKSLPQRFYNRPTIDVAKALLGKYLVYGGLRGKIVETEAYLYRGDPGCHAARGITRRNAPMFGPAGCTYVYLIYGMYYCLNIVGGKTGEGEAILIRALEPIDGIDIMRKRRKTDKIENLCSGPGKLTQAFGITKEHNDLNLLDSTVLQLCDGKEVSEIITTTRIGLSKGMGDDLELRFYIAGSKFVSKYA